MQDNLERKNVLVLKINDCQQKHGVCIDYNSSMLESIISNPVMLNDTDKDNHSCIVVGKYSDNIIDVEHFEFTDLIMLDSNCPQDLLNLFNRFKIEGYVYSLTTSKKSNPHYLVLLPLNRRIYTFSDYEKIIKDIINCLGTEKFDNKFVKPTSKIFFPPLINESTDYEYYCLHGRKIDEVLTDLKKEKNNNTIQLITSSELDLKSLKMLSEGPIVENLEIIEGIAKEGYVGLFAAPSKAGKSQIMIELSIAVASGTLWMNKYKCALGNVLYINTEIDKNDIISRFIETMKAFDVNQDVVMDKIWLMNLRGHSHPLKDLENRIIKESIEKKVKLIVLDPIYKLQNGDENSVRDVTEFMDTAIQIAEKTHAFVILVHHYSKGSKDNVNSLDRSSGSGSFARAVDSYIDCVEIEPQMPEEEMLKFGNTTFYRISMILRSYPYTNPIEIAYEYPKHYVVNGLDDAPIKKSGSGKKNLNNVNKLRSQKLEGAISSVGNHIIDVANFVGVHENTISNWIKTLPEWEKKNGYLFKKQL